MSLESLQSRLSALQDTTQQIQTLISRLANLKFQPGSIPIDNEEGDVSEELRVEIHQSLKEQEEDIELLEQDATDLPPGRVGSQREEDKRILLGSIGRAGEELKTTRRSYRRAQLIARSNLAAAQQQERALLLASLTAPPSTSTSPSSSQFLPPRRQKASVPQTKEEKTLAASSDVTLALRRTHNLLSSELSRSQFAHETLNQSTATLAQLSENYSTLDTLLSSSKTLVGTLLRSQKSDTWYLETAFWILAITIGWLIFRRWIYGPAWWFVWLPIKWCYKTWMGVFTMLGLRGGTAKSMVSDSTVSSARVEASMSAVAVPTMINTEKLERGEKGTESIIEEIGQIIDGEGKENALDGIDLPTEEHVHSAQEEPRQSLQEEHEEVPGQAQHVKDEL